MKVIQKINNNVALGKDSNGRDVVIFGKGVGFPQVPYEVDLSKIDRTFYDVDERYYRLFNEIDPELIYFVGNMIDIIQSKIPGRWDRNLIFILSDHLHFCLQRIQSGMIVDFPYSYEIENDFPEFNRYAKWIVQNVNKKMNVHLEKGEITCIAMHLISAFEGTNKAGVSKTEKSSRILKNVTKIIEDYFNIKINQNSMNFFRFRYHIQYFVKRKENHEELTEEMGELFDGMKESYPKTYQCVCEIKKYLEEEFQETCSNDELLYLNFISDFCLIA